MVVVDGMESVFSDLSERGGADALPLLHPATRIGVCHQHFAYALCAVVWSEIVSVAAVLSHKSVTLFSKRKAFSMNGNLCQQSRP